MAICQCGCGQPIPEKPHHKRRGTPRFILGHNSRTPERRAFSSDLARGNHFHNKGGRVLRHGYWYVFRPDHPHATKQGYVAEHRLVMEDQLGRILEPCEKVHHLNGDKLDNRPENLALMPTQGRHLLKHPGNVMHRVVVEGMFFNRHSGRWEHRHTA